MADMSTPIKNTAFTLYFTLYKNDGTIIANPGTYTRATSIDGAGVDTSPNNTITEEDTTYGQLSWLLDAAEMNGDAIWIFCKDDTTGCVPFTCTIYPATANAGVQVGAAGAGLTAVPWNAAWDAEVQSEVEDALIVNNLDHLAKTATAGADMTTEVTDGSILSRIISNSDTSLFVPSTHSLGVVAADVAAVHTHAGNIDTAVITNAAGTDIAADIIALQGNVTDILADTDELQENQGDWATATGFSTFDPAADDVAVVNLVDVCTENTDMVDISTLGTNVILALKLLRNKTETDPSTGIMTVYDDNGSTVLFTANIYKDVAGNDLFDGAGANRRDRLV